jgi:type II secretory pathway pseudopilin PulG
MDRARCRGTTIVELLVVTLISSLLSTIALACLIACIKTSSATSARVEVNETMERVLERIGKGIRAGTALGQVYVPAGTAPKWQCDNDTLVVQTPITDANGFNSYVQELDPITGESGFRLNVETLVYEVTPSPQDPKTYNLQLTRYPGAPIAGYVPGPAKPQILLTRLIGPLDSSGSRPKIFQYVDSSDSSGTAHDTVDGNRPNDFNMVLVNLESQKQDARGRAVETIGLKAEYYLHNCGR